MYAVIKTGGKQYKVTVGERLKVEKIPVEVGSEMSFDNVFAIGEGKFIHFGTLLHARVKATVVAHGDYPKVNIFKLRRRKHYQKRASHRQNYTELRIDSMSAKII